MLLQFPIIMTAIEFPPFAQTLFRKRIALVLLRIHQINSEDYDYLNEYQLEDIAQAISYIKTLLRHLDIIYRLDVEYLHNLLNWIWGYIAGLEIDGHLAEHHYPILQHIYYEIFFCRQLIYDLCDYFWFFDSTSSRYIPSNHKLIDITNRLQKVDEIKNVDSNLIIKVHEEYFGRCPWELIANARKHNPGATVKLHVTQYPDEIQISVTDNGKGIPPEHHTDIFKPFWRYPDTLETFGMGLAVVKGIMQLHGGDVTVTSEVGKGSTFTLHLPQT